MAAAAILVFKKKIRNFNGLSHVLGQSASPCQISSKSVKRLRRYGDLTVFEMAAVWGVKRPILHIRAQIREDL